MTQINSSQNKWINRGASKRYKIVYRPSLSQSRIWKFLLMSSQNWISRNKMNTWHVLAPQQNAELSTKIKPSIPTLILITACLSQSARMVPRDKRKGRMLEDVATQSIKVDHHQRIKVRRLFQTNIILGTRWQACHHRLEISICQLDTQYKVKIRHQRIGLSRLRKLLSSIPHHQPASQFWKIKINLAKDSSALVSWNKMKKLRSN